MNLRSGNKYEVKCGCQKWFPNPKFNNLCSECYSEKYPDEWLKHQEENWTHASYIPKHKLDRFILDNRNQFPATQWKMLLATVKEQNDILPLLTMINYIKRHNKDFIGITAEQGAELYAQFKKYHKDKFKNHGVGEGSDWRWQHLFAGMIFDIWNIRPDKHGPVAYCYYGNFGAKPRGTLNKEDYVSVWINKPINRKELEKKLFWMKSLPDGLKDTISTLELF